MSSMNVHIGFAENRTPKKNVPQGRSHTDIFGTEPIKPTPKKNIPTSSIQNILMQEEVDGETNVKNESKACKENITKDCEGNEIKESKDQKEHNIENGNGTPAFPQRVRMPPGGHSTGFW